MSHPVIPEAWEIINAQRGDLIHKEIYGPGLSAEESLLLKLLQDLTEEFTGTLFPRPLPPSTPGLKQFMCPKMEDCKPGLWAVLNNGWVVGPIVSTEFDGQGVYVQWDGNTWQVSTIDQPETNIDSPRLVVRVGTRKELTGKEVEWP